MVPVWVRVVLVVVGFSQQSSGDAFVMNERDRGGSCCEHTVISHGWCHTPTLSTGGERLATLVSSFFLFCRGSFGFWMRCLVTPPWLVQVVKRWVGFFLLWSSSHYCALQLLKRTIFIWCLLGGFVKIAKLFCN